MKIVLNGQEREIAAGATVLELIQAEGDPPEAVIVEINSRFVSPRVYVGTSCSEGDRVEIILAVIGG